MALSWETFRSALGLSSNTSVFYVDEEESKIPIDSECEFQEALRLAKLNKNSLKLVFHGDKQKLNEMIAVDQCQSVTNPVEKCVEYKVESVNATSQNSSWKGNKCNCQVGGAPEWFTHYMKKFKKEILHEMKSYIHDTVHSTVEKKFSSSKSESAELFCERNENLSSPISTDTKRKKKMSERDLTDTTDQRQIRLPRKYGTKPERLELLDQKTRALLEERRRLLLENRHNFKSKLEKSSIIPSGKNFFSKAASFGERYVYMMLPAESEFTVTVNITNDGFVWRSPALVCIKSKGVFLEEYIKPLPKLHRRESTSVEVRGKLSGGEVSHYFKYVVADLEMEISPEFMCRINVVPEKFSSEAVKETDGVSTQVPEGAIVTLLSDIEKDLIASSQKKIEENISEIERRLHDIELLQPTTTGKGGKEANGFDVWSGLDKLAQETEVDPVVTEQGSGECNANNENENGKYGKETNKDCKKDGETGSSDSEVSIVFLSEEEEEEEEEEEDEDNFFVVPCESLNTAESTNEVKTSPNTDVTFTTTTTREQSATVKKQPAKADLEREPDKCNPICTESFQKSPTRPRCSPFAENISKPKKMKSESTEYRFTAANLTQPTFTQIPRFFEGRPSKFTFTGEKEEKPKQEMRNSIPETDALGRVIYAVNSYGLCLPVKELFRMEEDDRPGSFDRPSGSQSQEERSNAEERLNDSPSVNNLPNALINGASSVASLAFNTAKSVINNLQSAFVTEGKTEMGQPAYEDKVKLSTEALFKLFELGFLDIARNRTLLLLHNNDVNKVIDELIRMS